MIRSSPQPQDHSNGGASTGNNTVDSRLHHAIEHAAHLLPSQGPILVFIHHNTLHGFEDLPFMEAVKKGGKVFGCTPFLSEQRFRSELERGRIRFSDLQEVLTRELGNRGNETIFLSITRFDLRFAMLQYPLRTASKAELIWYVAETDALRKISPDVSTPIKKRLIAETRHWVMRDLRAGYDPVKNGSNSKQSRPDTPGIMGLLERFGESSIEEWSEDTWESFTLQTLWRICCDGVKEIPSFTVPPTKSIRHRDLLFEATGVDSDLLVHEILIRFCAAYLDQGFSTWPLPDREEGFLRSFSTVFRTSHAASEPWVQGLKEEFERIEREKMTPEQSIRESLEILGVTESEWDEYFSVTFLALRGWGGMIHHVESRGDRVAHPIAENSLVEFLAVRLLLDRLVLRYVARKSMDYEGSLANLREFAKSKIEPYTPPSIEQRAFLIFQITQALGIPPNEMSCLSSGDWAKLVEEIELFSSLERREIFHSAYERRFYNQTLDAISIHSKELHNPVGKPKFQVDCCIDEREESFRRALEEVFPHAETFGTAGFFAIAMYYRGCKDAHFVPLCPVVIRPQHYVVEQVVEDLEEKYRRQIGTRKAFGRVSHQLHVGTRSPAIGAILSASLGVLASIPLVARILFPRLTARIRQFFGRVVQPPVLTRLQLDRKEESPSKENGGIGYSLVERANIAERVLRDIGLTKNFSRLVFCLGHGSNSLNNPHESAHDCGACGGSPGAPNGRAIAQIFNDPPVREILASRGLIIPRDTYFVGGYHNTCNDSLTVFDTDRIPESHSQEFLVAVNAMEMACDRDAHERCRRFHSAPLTLSLSAARQHVEGRAEDLAQTRPEFGHATNAICIVGRRNRTRGLYLDRRAFLVSYDPTQDTPEADILGRTLAAVFPVCAGINLEYYFSVVDSTGWGCGTKLPHNITSLLGVMDGAASDLRTGLPWQMVEIHEPVRLLFVIETTPEIMFRIMEKNAGIDRLVRNQWVQVSLLDPHSSQILYYHNGTFQAYQPEAKALPQAPTSIDWYRGWRDHLEFAQIGLQN